MSFEASETTRARIGRSDFLYNSPVSPTEPDFLRDDLLGEHEDEPSPLPPKIKPESVATGGHFSGKTALPSTTRKSANEKSVNRLVVAIDYGTTFTGIAYATPSSQDASIADVKVIVRWGKGMSNTKKVPSVYSYSPAPKGELQWGYSLSDNAVTMINTKLELDVQDNKSDELRLLLQVLDGMRNLSMDYIRDSRGYPEYTSKNPEQIMTDYMTSIFTCFENETEAFGSRLKGTLPVDIVVTVPVEWSYGAKNTTLRAIRAAGFNETTFPNLQRYILVTEPEAATIYTARYLKTKMEEDFLKVDECFVLCDAGGGTVDVISYKVLALSPSLQLERIGYPNCEKCGAAYIDLFFKRWLYNILGETYFSKLDPQGGRMGISSSSESGHMREVMKQFDVYKRTFSSQTTDGQIKIKLTGDLADITIPGKVDQGLLVVSNNDMKRFFDHSINGVIELYQGQLQHIENKGRRLRNVFLIGGFGDSPFLQEEFRQALRYRKVELRRPDESWSAVVCGAVMYGIEKANLPGTITMKTSPRSYGIVLNEAFIGSRFRSEDRYLDRVTGEPQAQGQITWLVKKGDLILSDDGRTSEKEFRVTFTSGKDANDRKLHIYEYEDDDLPDRFQNSHLELKEVGSVTYNLSQYPLDGFDSGRNPKTGQAYYIAYLTCKMKMMGSSVTVEILWNDQSLCQTTLGDVDHGVSARRWDSGGRRERQYTLTNSHQSVSSLELPGSSIAETSRSSTPLSSPMSYGSDRRIISRAESEY